MEPKIDVEPDAWATKDMCVGPNYGKVRFDKLPIQSLNQLQYTHEKLYSEKTVIGLMKAAYEAGKKDGWEACETCHGIVDGVMPNKCSTSEMISNTQGEDQ